jgi:hypothetical protein
MTAVNIYSTAFLFAHGKRVMSLGLFVIAPFSHSQIYPSITEPLKARGGEEFPLPGREGVRFELYIETSINCSQTLSYPLFLSIF